MCFNSLDCSIKIEKIYKNEQIKLDRSISMRYNRVQFSKR